MYTVYHFIHLHTPTLILKSNTQNEQLKTTIYEHIRLSVNK
jgi:hypothetical protein